MNTTINWGPKNSLNSSERRVGVNMRINGYLFWWKLPRGRIWMHVCLKLIISSSSHVLYHFGIRRWINTRVSYRGIKQTSCLTFIGSVLIIKIQSKFYSPSPLLHPCATTTGEGANEDQRAGRLWGLTSGDGPGNCCPWLAAGCSDSSSLGRDRHNLQLMLSSRGSYRFCIS